MSRNRLCRRTAFVLVGITGAILALRLFAGGFVADVFANLSLSELPTAERHLVEFLLLLPVAALIVCGYRNLIGIASFGIFAPALVGLVFRDLGSLPGLGVFVGLLLAGWIVRRVIHGLRLLQVPRASVMLSLIVVLLVGIVVIARRFEIVATNHVSLFPVIILTGMVERFWLMETDDGAGSSIRALIGTLVIAVTVALVAGIPAVGRTLLHFPETLGLVIALQVLIGRYTGYRLMELWRFRELTQPPAESAEEAMVIAGRMPMQRF
jgi:hypothetical protein